MNIKRFLGNIALLIFALVSAFAIGEIVVRLLYKDVSVMYPRYHTDYHYGRYTIRGNRPNAVFWHTSVDGSWKFVTNSKGFRNTKEFTYKKPANTIRVLSLGDSHTQGHEVRQEFTFSAVLERFLNQHKVHAEVINAGVSGFGNAEELVFLENEGFKYKPDVVVLGFFANDFEDNVKAGLFGLDNQNHLVEQKFEHIPGVRIQNVIYSIPGVKWLSENSYFYSLLFNSTWNYFKLKLGEQAAKQVAARDNVPPTTGGFEFAVPTSATHSEYETDLAAALIERMQQFCVNQGIHFIVVDIPTMPKLYHYASSLSLSLRKKLDAAHVEYISSESLLQKFDGVAEMHVPHGYHHISEFTHTLIGMEIAQRMLVSGAKAAKQ
jgi:GDSL-like Lipase/Acylhydrolase family